MKRRRPVKRRAVNKNLALVAVQRRKNNKRGNEKYWTLAETKQHIPQMNIYSSRCRPGASAEPAAEPGQPGSAQTPQVRDTGGGDSALGWFISTH